MKNKEKRLKIAILGEHPDNDAESFRTLLEKRPYPNAQFDIPIRNLRGGQLDVPAAVVRQIKNVKREKSIDKFIIIRDLDGILLESEKVKSRDEWFQKVNQGIDGNGIFYLLLQKRKLCFYLILKLLIKSTVLNCHNTRIQLISLTPKRN
jgi:hypothetical protein